MKNIGGFFELEIANKGYLQDSSFYALSTGRACLMVLLKAINPKLVYVPFYTCDATLEPFRLLGINIRYYELNGDLTPKVQPDLLDGEYFLWTNYFGLKSDISKRIINTYGQEKVILDDTHNFFGFENLGCWSFTSVRKYFGVGDGALLYAPKPIDVSVYPQFESSTQHCALRLAGHQQEAFAAYQTYEASLDCSIGRMSSETEKLMQNVDLFWAMKQRLKNFSILHKGLERYNTLAIESSSSPYCYPLLPQNGIELSLLHENGIFVPRLWADVLKRKERGFLLEKEWSQHLIALPIDHRYSVEDMQSMVDVLSAILDQVEN
ncbi:hypothetical protein [Agarivorans albus]|uniref:DegT/DnrJ/EryC1/StrS aminotransferase family protein n=1 Tax=Agarivorans albus MKT 106 TaxID=1331007 RepID=R9PN28_AGAAL|nr:hypothetical protein [Agarivorans albus]GAD02683.1 hypothetical protein AALB_2763 [Agarivorans albus MKT 106]